MRFELVKGQKRLVVLGAVMAAAIAFCIYIQFMTHSPKETPVSPIPSDLPKTGKISESKPLDVPEVTVKKGPPDKAWEKDPFGLPPGVELRVAGEGESVTAIRAHGKRLTAILISDSRKLASINDKMVEVGDLIDGERVSEIKPDGVILEKGGRKREIRLEGSHTQWTKNGRGD